MYFLQLHTLYCFALMFSLFLSASIKTFHGVVEDSCMLKLYNTALLNIHSRTLLEVLKA